VILRVAVNEDAAVFLFKSSEMPTGFNASLELVIDAQNRTLRRSTTEWSLLVDDSETRRHYRRVDVYSDWGSTDVSRPGWAGNSLDELLLDVQNHERDHWVGSESWAPE
jgi:hypothetical protein